MNMQKALQHLYKAVSGQDTSKVNISKLLVDIHQAVTGKESANKNNWSRIIDSIAENWIGGGNPNQVQTITGTVATPVGEEGSPGLFASISEAIFNKNATAKMSITVGQQTGWAYLLGTSNGAQLQGYASMVNADSFLTMRVVWNLVGGNISLGDFESIQGASGAYQVTDLKSMASMCTTELTIIWHPLPIGD